MPKSRVVVALSLIISLTFIGLSSKIAVAHSPLSASASKETKPLVLGQPIESDLKGGETHLYFLELAAGQFVRVEIEQLGIDVMIAFRDPLQATALEFNFDNGQLGKEYFCFVAQHSGRHELQLRPFISIAKPARYRVQIKKLQTATETDRERFAAQKLLNEAAHLLKQENAESRKAALPKLEAALRIWKKSGDQDWQYLTLFLLGVNLAGMHEHQRAITAWEQARQLSHNLGWRRDEARMLYELASVYWGLVKFAQARELLQQGRTLCHQVGDQGCEGRMLYLLGDSYYRDDPKLSIDLYYEAEKLLQSAGDIQFEAEVNISLGIQWLILDDADKAMIAMQKATALTNFLPWQGIKSAALDNLSKVYVAQYDYERALDTQYQALAIRQSMGDVEAVANSYRYLGSYYMDLGDPQRAIGLFEQSIKLRKSIGFHARALLSQTELGIAYNLLGKYQQARDYFLSILPLAREVGDKLIEAKILEHLAVAYNELGEYHKAIESVEQARVVLGQALFPSINHRFLLPEGKSYSALGNYDKARELFTQALTVAENLKWWNGEVLARINLAHTERKQGNMIQARTQLETALEIMEMLRKRFASPALRASTSAAKRQAFEEYLLVLCELHRQEPAANHLANAFHISEKLHARSLLETLREIPAELRKGIDPALLERERELQRQLTKLTASQDKVGHQTVEQVVHGRNEIALKLAELEVVEAKIRTANPGYATLAQPQPLTAQEIQKGMAKSELLLLEYALGEEQSFLFTITGDTFNIYELPKRETIDAAAARYYELLTARNRTIKFEESAQRAARIQQADAELAQAGTALSQMILAPATAELKQRQLVIVADGKLQYIPFAALPTPASAKSNRPNASSPRRPVTLSRYLIEDHVISYLPSASVLGVLRNELKDRKPAPKTLAVFADPVFEGNDERLAPDVRARIKQSRQQPEGKTPAAQAVDAPVIADQLTRAIQDVTGDAEGDGERGGLARLPFTRAEAEAILKLVPDAQQKLSAFDFAAHQDAALKEELSQYRYVHFATHGLIDNAHPDLSGLVLSRLDEQGRERDGYLRMVEIMNLRLPAELVVLSACKTGLGKDVRGEGLMSLTRGFMYAGAARVLVSLWDVNDESTASLMSELYRGLLQKKQPPATALRAAQLAMLKSKVWQSPYHWAAFVQHGEPQ